VLDSLQRLMVESGWQHAMRQEFEKDYMLKLSTFLTGQYDQGKVIYPEVDHYFNAFNAVPFDDVKVVILGQDPYHGPEQAHGLCFSVPPDVTPPPSLKNIFKELQREYGMPIPEHGCLQSWAAQGVLLLNSVLTVEQGKAGAHSKKGWETFTDAVIHQLNEKNEGVVFLLWGNYAQKKGQYIHKDKHCVLTSVHPSPLSAYRGFIGCGHFSKANEYLVAMGKESIDWCLPRD